MIACRLSVHGEVGWIRCSASLLRHVGLGRLELSLPQVNLGKWTRGEHNSILEGNNATFGPVHEAVVCGTS
jgi:hypothetical protein